MAASRKTGDGFRRAYRTQLKADLDGQLQRASIIGRIVLARSPSDFTSKRTAIRAGYQEGIRLAKGIKEKLK